MCYVFSICTHTLSSTLLSCQVRMCPVCGHFLDIPLTFAPCPAVAGDYIIDMDRDKLPIADDIAVCLLAAYAILFFMRF